MSEQESLDVTRIHSVAGLIGEQARLVEQRPFRSPHHNVSVAGLVGGGAGLARPGEVALAHNGVLFMDELPLFRRDVLESLRGPLEDGVVHIVRSGGAVAFPCRFSLVAAMNPCPCGYGEEGSLCPCPTSAVRAYRSRITGPLMDRFDLHLSMTRPRAADLVRAGEGESSAVVRRRVEAARAAQRDRYGPSATNASVSRRVLATMGGFRAEAHDELRRSIDEHHLTGRGMDRVLRVARTIADLSGSREVRRSDVAAAVAFRYVRESEVEAA